jgi:predicted DNA-binding transcriptional regulator AlpA
MGELIDESGLARLVALKPSYLRKLRISGGGPKFIKIGRSVRYRVTDVENWLASRTRRNTAEGG